MNEVNNKEFTHLKIHTQYSICEGALRTTDLAKYCKEKQIKALKRKIKTDESWIKKHNTKIKYYKKRLETLK